MWGDAMKVVQRWLPDTDFRSPDPRTIKGQQVTVPSVYGYEPDEAAKILREAGLFPPIGPLVDSENAYGTVAYLDPASGSTIGSGSSVTIYLSDGSPYVPPAPEPEPEPAPQPAPAAAAVPAAVPDNGGGDGAVAEPAAVTAAERRRRQRRRRNRRRWRRRHRPDPLTQTAGAGLTPRRPSSFSGLSRAGGGPRRPPRRRRPCP